MNIVGCRSASNPTKSSFSIFNKTASSPDTLPVPNGGIIVAGWPVPKAEGFLAKPLSDRYPGVAGGDDACGVDR